MKIGGEEMVLIDGDRLADSIHRELCGHITCYNCPFRTEDGGCEVERWLDDAPVVEPKQGEWIKHDEERDCCSVCKHIFKTRILTKQDKWTTYVDDLGYNFCPNCGCRMKGADDED